MNLLHIDTSIRGEQSVSRLLSKAAVQRMQEHDPAIDVIYRDLVAAPVPHLTGEHLAGSPSVKEEIALGEELLEEFISADVVVIGVAFYNLTISSQLAAAIAAKRTSLTPEEAKVIAKRAVEFKRERGRLPSISSADAWEKHLAEGAAAFVRFKDEGRYE